MFVHLMAMAKNGGGFIGLYQETAQPALTLTGLNNFKLPVPPLAEQKAISDYLDKECSKIDQTISQVVKQIELLEEYKQSLITEVVTGKRKVC